MEAIIDLLKKMYGEASDDETLKSQIRMWVAERLDAVQTSLNSMQEYAELRQKAEEQLDCFNATAPDRMYLRGMDYINTLDEMRSLETFWAYIGGFRDCVGAYEYLKNK